VPPNVHRGSTGAAVSLVQYELCRDQFLSGPDDVDGNFGGRTESAVRDYQSGHGLVSDGIVGPSTWSAMLARHPDPPVLQSGSHGDVVRHLQHFLNQANPPASPALSEDGSFGPRTTSATKNYQQAHGVSADGIVAYKTWVIHIGAAGATVASAGGV